MRAMLLTANPDLSAIVHTMCDRAGIDLTVYESDKHLLRAAAALQDPDFLILDCSTADPNDVDRCTHILAATMLHVDILHPRAEFVHDLASSAPSRLTWLTPADLGLAGLEKLRLRRATARTPRTHPLLAGLKPRDLEVLRGVARDASNRQIAATIGRSTSTVKEAIVRLKEAFGAADRKELGRLYRQLDPN